MHSLLGLDRKLGYGPLAAGISGPGGHAMSKLDFAALLCSRLCHDLVSPVGAISNGIEILQEEHDAAMREQVIDLLQKSAQQTSNKLQFFRLAFGAAGGFSSRLDMREVQKALSVFLEGTRVTLDWKASVADAPKGIVKLILNLCLVASETLIRGGVMEVRIDPVGDNAIDIVVFVSGERFIMQEAVRAALVGEVNEEEVEPRSAPAWLASTTAKELGGTISVSSEDGTRHRLAVQVRSSGD